MVVKLVIVKYFVFNWGFKKFEKEIVNIYLCNDYNGIYIMC